MSDDRGFRWGLVEDASPRTLKVGGAIGYCVGGPLPKLGRPEIVYEGDDVQVRLRVIKPRNNPGEAKAYVIRGDGERMKACFGKEIFIYRTIPLQRDLSEVEVYNANVDPPEQIWPE